ncbi:nuclear transport factor 2 family protein [Streptomyces genisteinicus]|uniref:Nuclear transport factor 2 family protein n=1 Tax=Streptomyces genisteinicus TaxID=2768068 RepID=A0A7H0HXM3_9ACTN|nr:nuclear transport factor 2 family protein [Streptomyces genisteinicus]QNP65289.1 nuclear transport factor 2 family protein [Streptomyces genisteinicus]
MTVLPETGHTPTAGELAEIERWFETYDALSAARDIEGMADMAVFPLNLVSDDASARGASAQWDREQFVATMTQVMGQGGEPLSFSSERTPVFLSPAMVVVFTDSAMTAGGTTERLRYADVLIRRADGWAFQTMIQSGWGENLR